LISVSARLVAGSSSALSQAFASPALRLKYSRYFSVTIELMNWVSTVMYVCCVHPAALPSRARPTRSLFTSATNALAAVSSSGFGGGFGPGGPLQEASRQAPASVSATEVVARK
jgi:hypothetical protein